MPFWSAASMSSFVFQISELLGKRFEKRFDSCPAETWRRAENTMLNTLPPKERESLWKETARGRRGCGRVRKAGELPRPVDRVGRCAQVTGRAAGHSQHWISRTSRRRFAASRTGAASHAGPGSANELSISRRELRGEAVREPRPTRDEIKAVALPARPPRRARARPAAPAARARGSCRWRNWGATRRSRSSPGPCRRPCCRAPSG